MHYYRPQMLLAGFHADLPDPEVPELVHVGEQWAPAHFVIPRHMHPVWEFYLQLDGQSQWESAGTRYVLRPGSFFAAPPNVRHAMEEEPKAKHHYFFAAMRLEKILERHPALKEAWRQRRCVHFPHGESVMPPFRQLIREVSMRLPHRGEGLRAALDYLVIEASRLFERSAEDRVLVPGHPAVQTAAQLLQNHPAQPWRLADLGRLAGVSPNHLVQLFRREIGLSPHQYLLRQRIERAKEMLRGSDVPITQMALELGFSSSQHFAKMFRHLAGCSAVQFRRSAQAGPVEIPK
jgi:AraC-like DNA-binding protein